MLTFVIAWATALVGFVVGAAWQALHTGQPNQPVNDLSGNSADGLGASHIAVDNRAAAQRND